jgi:hypothetical protein
VNWDSLGTIVSVVVGWLVGLLSSPIADWLKDRRRRSLLAAGLVLQAMHVREMAIDFVFSLRGGSGQLSRHNLNWIVRQLTAASQSIVSAGYISELQDLLKRPDPHFEAWLD